MSDTRKCFNCKGETNLIEFSKSKRKLRVYDYICKTCDNLRGKNIRKWRNNKKLKN